MQGTSKTSGAPVAHTINRASVTGANLTALEPASAGASKTEGLSKEDQMENLMLLSSWLYEGGPKPDKDRQATFLTAINAMFEGKRDCVVNNVPDIHFLKGFTFNTPENSRKQEVSRVTAAHSAAKQELSRLESMKPAGGEALDFDAIRSCQDKLTSLERQLHTFSIAKRQS